MQFDLDDYVGRLSDEFNRSKWLTALGIGIAFAMMVLGSVTLVSIRNDVWHQATRSAENLLLALDRDIARNFTTLDLSLMGLIDGLTEPGIDQASPIVRHHALFDRSTGAEDLGSMVVINKYGQIIEDSTLLVSHKIYLGDREYFQAHIHDSNVGLYISRAFKSRLGDGDLRFAISRRISTNTGEFAGVATAGLRLSYFAKLFEKLQVGQKGTITLLRTDGHILVRHPFKAEDVDVNLASNPIFAKLSIGSSGSFVARSVLDGVERLYTFRRISGIPLILTVNLSTEEIYASWRRKTMVIGPVLILLCAAAVISSMLFRHEMTRRTKSERALATAAQQLSVSAATDGLTSLANRRTFDLEFDRAARRAVRQGTSVAVLMLDADFFKRYNDIYGHLAGDEVLRSIAGCMRMHVRRPDDMNARYGGEEFVAILPETSLEAAHSVGEHVRAAVEELKIEHTGNPAGHVTVSIGVAAITPMVGFVQDHLLQYADKALYAAKRDGKNCVRSFLVLEDSADEFSICHPLSCPVVKPPLQLQR